MAAIKDLEVTALNALAASPGGTMTVSDLTAHLETRLGSSSEGSDDARSPESRDFREDMRRLVSSTANSGSLVDRGLATVDETGNLLRITTSGREYVGR